MYNTKLSYKLSLWSFIGTIYIVFYHSNYNGFFPVIEAKSTFDRVVLAINDISSGFCLIVLSFFFCKSAYLMFCSLNADNLSKKLRQRILSLGIPFVLWNVIYFVNDELPASNVREFFYGLIHSKYCVPMWFNMTLLWFHIIGIILWYLLRKNKAVMVSCIGVLICCFYFWHDNMRMVAEANFINFYPAYLAGMLMAVLDGTGCTYSGNTIKYAGWTKVLQDSFFIYAAHFLVIKDMDRVLRNKLHFFDFIPHLDSWVILPWRIFVAGIVSAICVVLAYGLRKVAPKIYRILIGGRG